MDGKLKMEWVKALRSKRFRQGKGNLYYKGKYCCLGVLCRIRGVKPETLLGVGFPSDLDIRTGLTEAKQRKLAHMNDGDGGERHRYTFREIADFIEGGFRVRSSTTQERQK